MEQAKKDCILLEAAKAFGRLGFKKASIDAIAKAAGVAKGTVYLAAESKKDLFYQVLHQEVCQWVSHVQRAIDPRLPADELLDVVSTAGAVYLEDRPLLKALLFGEAHSLMPGWTERLDGLVDLGRGNAERILRLGIQQGIFKESIDVEEVARILLDMHLSFYVFHDRGGDRERKMMRRRDAALDLMLNGLRADPAALTAST